MALLVMRLKLFATPQLCLLSALLASPSLLHFVFGRPLGTPLRGVVVVLVLAGMAQRGLTNLEEQLAIRGEYNNPEQEALFQWVQSNTGKGRNQR